MSAMPECDRLIASFRAQSNVGEAIGCAHEAINALRAALRAAEARAKAMEDGPLDYMSGKCDRLKEENATLRAERDALVPLLRYFVEYVEDGMYEWEDPKAPDHACDFLDNPESGYCEFHDKWGEARAILAREET